MRHERRVLAGSLLLSALAHAIAFAIAIEVPGTSEEKRARAALRHFEPGQVMRVLNLTGEIPAATVQEREVDASPDADSRAVPPEPPGASSAVSARADGSAEAGAGGGRPFPVPSSDPRLWRSLRDPMSSPADPALEERLRLEVRVDSSSFATAGLRIPPGRDMDVWAGRDHDGARRGLSPGAIHLGSLTIPLCGGAFDASSCGFGVPGVRRDEYRARLRVLVELQRQGGRAELLERARATRARADSTRDSIPQESRMEWSRRRLPTEPPGASRSSDDP